MNQRLAILFVLFLAHCLICLAGCGEEEEMTPSANASIMIGQGNTFSNTSVSVPAGGMIAIINQDNTPHTITSQSASDAFDATGDFDVLIPSQSKSTFQIPDDTPPGTVFFFYCSFHTSSMTPSTGTITVDP